MPQINPRREQATFHAARLESSQLIGSRYRLLRTLGQGGMGGVYLVEDCQTQKVCALKLLQEQKQGRARALARFKCEFVSLLRLAHPHCIDVYELGEYEEQLFIRWRIWKADQSPL